MRDHCKFSHPDKRKERVSYLKLLLISLGLVLFAEIATFAQSNVTTQHYDIARTGANTNETILTPANVNTNTFGKLFSYPVDGWVYAQPLYMSGMTMGAGTAQAGTAHNVVFVVTEHDSVFAFDADSNTGANANPLWHVSLLGAGETTVPSGDVSTNDIVPEIGITSTPVIDPATNTIYVVAKSTVADTTFIQRLHALDITTGNEKFGGPVTLSASVPGNGNGSSGGTLDWDPKWQNNRASLLLLNGIVYIGFGSHGDNGPWHGWILAYNASTLKQTGAWCSTPNAAGSGIWMAGTGLAADVPSGKPYGRIFTATGNGTFDATAPNYTNAMDYGDSIIKLDLNNGVPTMNANGTVVGDDFTPHDQAAMDNADEDVASGGVVLLPDSVGGGGGAHQLVQAGKSGRVFVLNRENLGGYNPNNTTDPEEAASGVTLWGAPAYWNGNVYFWGTNDNLEAFSFANGALSASATSTSNESAQQYSPTPSVSANGTTNGIVWSLKTDNYGSQGTAILYAHDASNVANLLYSSESNVARDNPGNSVKFIVPTVVNGKVYVGSESQLSVYGLLNGSTQAATPVITPASQSFSPSVQVTITDSTLGASIYYTTDGSQPTTSSTQYTGRFTLTTTTTVNAIAAGAGLTQSPDASATYTLATQVAMPTFNPPPGYYTAVQSVTISTTTPNATIYYTIDGTTPTAASTKYAGPVSVGVTETLSAIAVASGISNSLVASGLYTFDLGASSINFASGFASGGMNLLGSAKLNGSSLELTDGGGNEAAAAWYQVEANIESFTTDFTFQITPGTNPTADGFTFAIQGNNSTAVGPPGGGLGYGPDTPSGTGGIPSSVAVKLDLYSNAGEGTDSTGLYTNGASPTTPAVDMTSSGVNLHSGDPFHVHITYDGTTLAMTITDTTTNATFTTNWTVDIPTIVGNVVAYVGFTAGTGGDTAVQNIQTWTFGSLGNPAVPVITSASTASGTVGSAFSYQITATNTPSSYGATGLPAGLSVNSGTGLISGTPTTAATSTVTLKAINGGGTGTATLTLTINKPAVPVITSASTASGTVGSAFSYQITATNTPSSYGATGLPAGLSVNSGTGLISGTPTTAATSTVTLSASNGGGTGTATLTLTINNPTAPVITSASTASGTVGSAFSYQITATNTPSSYGATGLPAGLSVNSGTGLISGTPTTAATSTVTLSAINGGGTGTATLTLTINNPTAPVITSASTASGTVGSAFSYQITATNTPSSYGATGLPAGLSVNSGTGLISGTPTTAATSTVTLSASNGGGTGNATLTLTITSGGTPVINLGTGFTTGAMTLNGNAQLNGTRLRLTDGTSTAAASAWYNTPVNIQQFTSNFSFQITGGTSPTADGFAFVIQGGSSSALGPPGGGLGYGPDTPSGTGGIPNSVAVKFDLYSNDGEGPDSTGLYVDGASPTIPAVDMTSSGVNLHTTDVFNVRISYDGTNLTMTITDATTNATFTQAWPINIPTTVGGNTALVGFTGGTGGLRAIQEIIGWTMSSTTGVAAVPVITSASTASGTVGSAFSYQITATNTPSSYGATGLPAGLSVNSGTGLISGTPTTAATSTVTLSAINGGGTGTATLTLTINNPTAPVITSASTASGTVGSAFSYQITATNTPSSYGATGLPAGLSVNSGTGLISGTPTTAATSTVTLSAINGGGTGTATLALTINKPAVPVITSASTASGTVGSAFSYQITATNTPSSYGATGLPAGLSVNSGTGLISGTPTTAATSTVTLSAINGGGTGTATLTLTINNPTAPVITSASTASGTVGSAFSYQITATNTPSSYGATGLPAGLSVNSGTGLISGTPTTAATSTVTLSASNGGGTGTATLALTINKPAVPVITSASTASGTVGSAFSYQITATNTPSSYGATGLPAGLSVNSGTGLISGTPKTAATSTVTLKAINGGGTGTATLTLTINKPAVPVITSASTASGTVGSAFSYQITATNTPSSYGATGLPAGLSVNSGTGLISGTPTTAATSTVTLKAINGGGTGTATLTLTINKPVPVITSASTASGTVGSAFSYQITATNTPSSYGATGLPAGLSVNSGTGLISGTPTTAATSTVTLSAINGGGTGTATLTLTINNPTAPVITSASTASGTVGSAFSYQITATNTPSSYGATGLPAGLSVNSGTGLISGTPTTAATSTVTLSASNGGGTGNATLTLTITSGGTPVINLGTGFTTGAMTLNGNAQLNGTRLRLTDGTSTAAASAWYNTPVNIQQFTSNFSFQITGGTSPTADGFAFVIQGGSSSALGPPGGGLGYGPDTPSGTGGIPNSVAVKFDLYSNDGEGPDSTGLYVDGASPTIPAVDMTSSGVNLHTTDVFNVRISYDGTNLTMTITDATTNATFTQAWPINIPTTVGGNTALVGFTGGTGGLRAIQEIIGWTMQ